VLLRCLGSAPEPGSTAVLAGQAAPPGTGAARPPRVLPGSVPGRGTGCPAPQAGACRPLASQHAFPSHACPGGWVWVWHRAPKDVHGATPIPWAGSGSASRRAARGWRGGTSQALAGRAPARAAWVSPPVSPPVSPQAGQILTGGGNDPRYSLIVASMVKRRRMFSQSAYGTGATAMDHRCRSRAGAPQHGCAGRGGWCSRDADPLPGVAFAAPSNRVNAGCRETRSC